MTIDTKALRELRRLLNNATNPADVTEGPRAEDELRAALREHAEELIDAADIGLEWSTDSSLKTWFPYTAERLAALEAELAEFRHGAGVVRATMQALEQDNERLLNAFRHTHYRSDDGDSCAKCGLDLRHPVHVRTL